MNNVNNHGFLSVRRNWLFPHWVGLNNCQKNNWFNELQFFFWTGQMNPELTIRKIWRIVTSLVLVGTVGTSWKFANGDNFLLLYVVYWVYCWKSLLLLPTCPAWLSTKTRYQRLSLYVSALLCVSKSFQITPGSWLLTQSFFFTAIFTFSSSLK